MRKTIFLSLALLLSLAAPAWSETNGTAQESNVVYVEQTTLMMGMQQTLSVKLKNDIGIQGVQFDMYLPDGISFCTDERGEADGITLNSSRATQSKTNYFNYALQSDGSLRVVFASKPGYAIAAGDGEVVSVNVQVQSNMTPGYYPLLLKNITLSDMQLNGYRTAAIEAVLTVTEPYATFTMPTAGIRTYSHDRPLDFTYVEGLKAYIASGFSPSTGEVLLTRVYQVPAGEGLLLKGDAGSFDVTCAETDMYYSNLLTGVVTATTVQPSYGNSTNYFLNNGENGIRFYGASAAVSMGNEEAYLQLPSTVKANGVRGIKMRFEDENGPGEQTGISEIAGDDGQSATIHDLQGRRVENTSKGVYIIEGTKKVVK